MHCREEKTLQKSINKKQNREGGFCFCYNALMTHGVDVNKNRLDDLDRVILRDSLSEPFSKKNICNIGCGESSLSIALCSLGHFVYNYDRRDLHSFFSMTSELFQKQKFVSMNISDIKAHNLPKQIHALVFQRVLHYLSYKNTQDILHLVTKQLAEGGKIYISLTGLDSQIGQGYTAKHDPITSRMGHIAVDDQHSFNITEKLCLYSKDEAEQLIQSIPGLHIEKIWISHFGNIKIVVQKI